MGIFDKAKGTASRFTGTGRAAEDPTMQSGHPILHAFLTHLVDDDGKPRETATILLFCEGGQFKCRLMERPSTDCMWTAAESLAELLEKVEECLATGTGDWRKSGPGGATKAKR